MTDENVTAEGTFSANLLTTKPVLKLGNFISEVPRINILGAKGSGKTYLYKQMLIAREWGEFLKIVNKVDYSNRETIICPVLCTEDRKNFQKILFVTEIEFDWEETIISTKVRNTKREELEHVNEFGVDDSARRKGVATVIRSLVS